MLCGREADAFSLSLAAGGGVGSAQADRAPCRPGRLCGREADAFSLSLAAGGGVDPRQRIAPLQAYFAYAKRNLALAISSIAMVR
jgi:hypothetical protein